MAPINCHCKKVMYNWFIPTPYLSVLTQGLLYDQLKKHFTPKGRIISIRVFMLTIEN